MTSSLAESAAIPSASAFTCKICGTQGAPESFQVREMMQGLREVFEYHRCPNCHSLQLASPPADFSRYYASDYYSFHPKAAARPSALERRLKHARARHGLGQRNLVGALLSRFKAHWPYFDWFRRARLSFDSRILDVGCGTGDYLLRFLSDGFTQLTGLDPFVTAELELAPGVRIHKKLLSDLAGPFDCVFSSHSFEHMPDPAASLADFARLLAPGGAAIIILPVGDCWAWEHYGVDWFQIDAPRHLTLPSRAGMKILAHRAGLQVEEIIDTSTESQFIYSELYRRDIPLCKAGPDVIAANFPPDTLSGFQSRTAALNAEGRGDQACFILRKPSPAGPLPQG